MKLALSTFGSLAKILSVREHQVEDALASERLARLTMDRRGFLRSVGAAAAAAALVRGVGFSELTRRWRQITINFRHGLESVILSEDVSFDLITPDAPGAYVQIMLRQDAYGGRAVRWPKALRWPLGKEPGWTARPNGIDMVNVYYLGNELFAEGVTDFT